MSLLKSLPPIQAFDMPQGFEFQPPSETVLDKWNAGIHAAASDDAETTISIYDVIGDSWDGAGMTDKKVAGILRNVGDREVLVNINSPGGDLFQGLAIYNLLREHKAKVTVRVLGLAASAASVIAMAGDEIQISPAAFVMIHNAWVIAMGNRLDLREFADWLEPFDSAMAGVYVARTGQKKAKVAALMDAETWINGDDAVKMGFADGLLPSDKIEEKATAKAETKNSLALRRTEAIFAAHGLKVSERRALLKSLKGQGTPSATATVMPDADGLDEIAAALKATAKTLTS